MQTGKFRKCQAGYVPWAATIRREGNTFGCTERSYNGDCNGSAVIPFFFLAGIRLINLGLSHECMERFLKPFGGDEGQESNSRQGLTATPFG